MIEKITITDPSLPITHVIYNYTDAFELIKSSLGITLFFIIIYYIASLFFKMNKNDKIAVVATNFLVVFPLYLVHFSITRDSGGYFFPRVQLTLQLPLLFIISLIEGFIYNKVLSGPKKIGFKFAFLPIIILVLLVALLFFIRQ